MQFQRDNHKQIQSVIMQKLHTFLVSYANKCARYTIESLIIISDLIDLFISTKNE